MNKKISKCFQGFPLIFVNNLHRYQAGLLKYPQNDLSQNDLLNKCEITSYRQFYLDHTYQSTS